MPSGPRSLLRAFLAVVALLFVSTCVAQQTQATDNPAVQAQTSADSGARLTIPAGTRLALVLMHPVDSKSLHHGDQLDAQTTTPVTVDDRVVIPPGTFVQGKIEKLKRKGNRAEFVVQSPAFVLPDGYVANLPERITITSGAGTAWRNPSAGVKAGAIAAPLAGVGLGMLAGSRVHTTFPTTDPNEPRPNNHKGLVVGGMVGGAVGCVTALVLLAHSHDFYVEAGAPMDVTLTEPVTLGSNTSHNPKDGSR